MKQIEASPYTFQEPFKEKKNWLESNGISS